MTLNSPKICLALLAALSSSPVWAQPLPTNIDILTAIELASARFSGNVIAADLNEGRQNEPDRFYSLRMLTPAGDIIEIRLDAANGTIFDVNGRGLVDARKPAQDS